MIKLRRTVSFKCLLIHVRMNAGADPGFFFRRGCTRLLLYFNTNKPLLFFLGRIPVVLENRKSSRGAGGVRTPCTLPQDQPLVRIIYEKTKGQVPLGTLLGNQNIQAKEVYWTIPRSTRKYKMSQLIINFLKGF